MDVTEPVFCVDLVVEVAVFRDAFEYPALVGRDSEIGRLERDSSQDLPVMCSVGDRRFGKLRGAGSFAW